LDFMIITTLDVLGRSNNREHHVITAARARYTRVVVVYRRRGGKDRGIRHMLRSGTDRQSRDGVLYVGVDPLLNPRDGAVRAWTEPSGGAGTLLRRGVGTALDSAAILRDLATIHALSAAADSEIGPEPPVCMAFGPWAARAAEMLRRKGRLGRYVYVDRDFEPGFMASAPRRAWAAAQERRAAARADLTLSIGNRLADRFRHIAGARVRLSPTGVDSAAIPSLIRVLPLRPLLFVGEVAPWSGIEEAIAALPLILPGLPETRLRVIGPVQDGYRAHLEKAARSAGVLDRLTILGSRPRSEVFAELESAGLGLAVFRAHPLRIHAAPLKLLEYMAAGLPALALHGSEAGDIVTGAGAGATCACDPDSIAAAVLRLAADPAAYTACSRAGPLAARARDWARIMAAEFHEIDAVYCDSAPPSHPATQ
jgi:glycosyltransferase involved in cell wall biosynthesis